MISHEIAFAEASPHMLLVDNLPEQSLLMRNYPELRCYRDIAFYWKYFLNPDRSVHVYACVYMCVYIYVTVITHAQLP